MSYDEPTEMLVMIGRQTMELTRLSVQNEGLRAQLRRQIDLREEAERARAELEQIVVALQMRVEALEALDEGEPAPHEVPAG